MKVIIVYESRYGNTKRVAEMIIEAMKEVGGLETDLVLYKEADLDKIPEYDAILIGSPTHIGGPTRGIKKFIDKLGKLGLEGKVGAVFGTYKYDFEKAVKKMENRINEKVPGLKILAPGLSIKVKGIKGPILEEDLPKCKEFGKKIGSKMKEA